MQLPAYSRWHRALLLSLGASLTSCTLLFLVWTWHWPLLGDASLIHYICFLMDHGMAPYRVLGDMNMPGSFLLEWAVMHSYGFGSLAWRLYDLTLAAVATLAMVSIARPSGWFAGLYAGLLFVPVHGADGLNDTGQRDLSLAVLLIAAYAFLFVALRRRQPWAMGLFGLCLGAAATIKPTVAPLGLLLLVLAWIVLRRSFGDGRGAWLSLAWGGAGLLIPLLAVLVFLLHWQALGAFVHGLHTVVPYYASLAHRPLGFLLLHSVSPVLPMGVLWLAVSWRVREWRRWESVALGLGLLFGLASYVVQAKGFAYYRYPLLLLLLLVMAMDCLAALRSPVGQPWVRIAAIAGLSFGAFAVAPGSTLKAHSFDWRDLQYIDALQADLTALHPQQGKVQCIDSIGGCGSTLYRMRLVQATGLLSDFLLFGSAEAEAVREARSGFLAAATANPPEILVISSGLHLSPEVGGYDKLERWPGFVHYLAANYTLARQWQPTRPVHWWARLEAARGYRIYLRKPVAPSGPAPAHL